MVIRQRRHGSHPHRQPRPMGHCRHLHRLFHALCSSLHGDHPLLPPHRAPQAQRRQVHTLRARHACRGHIAQCGHYALWRMVFHHPDDRHQSVDKPDATNTQFAVAQRACSHHCRGLSVAAHGICHLHSRHHHSPLPSALPSAALSGRGMPCRWHLRGGDMGQPLVGRILELGS